MNHATDAALDRLDDLLAGLRALAGLKERKRGVFYWKSSAFLHFHEDSAGIFADIRGDEGWTRLPVNTPTERHALVTEAGRIVDGRNAAPAAKRKSG